MPITRNAKKALRVSLRKKAVNDRVKKKLKEGVKEVEKLSLKKDWKLAKASLSIAYSAIDKAVKRGTIKKNTAARKKLGFLEFQKRNSRYPQVALGVKII